jgi:hypothetical protein
MVEEEEVKPTETQDKPEEGKKKRRGRPPGSGRKSRTPKNDVVTGAMMYVLGTGEPLESEPKVVKGENLSEAIKEFAEQADIKTDEVFVYELGQKVMVKTEVTISPIE